MWHGFVSIHELIQECCFSYQKHTLLIRSFETFENIRISLSTLYLSQGLENTFYKDTFVNIVAFFLIIIFIS